MGVSMICLLPEALALELVNDPFVQSRVTQHVDNFRLQPWVCVQGDCRMMFVFFEVETGVYEVHHASHRIWVKRSRTMAAEILRWLFYNGAKRVVSMVGKNNQTVLNMSLKIGGTITREDDEYWHLEFLLENVKCL